MLKFIIFIFITGLFVTGSFAQKGDTSLIRFKIKNGSFSPKEVTIISYQPNEAVNGAEQVVVQSKAEKEMAFEVGTKIFLANSKQVKKVMTGQKIDNEKPFLVVKISDKGKIFVF